MVEMTVGKGKKGVDAAPRNNRIAADSTPKLPNPGRKPTSPSTKQVSNECNGLPCRWSR